MTMIISKLIGDKRRWRQYKARAKQLPESYRTAVEAIERYLMYVGPGGDADTITSMFEDLIDLFERAAADATPLREIVGEDPVEFVEAFRLNYMKGGWITREQERMTSAINRAAGPATPGEGSSR